MALQVIPGAFATVVVGSDGIKFSGVSIDHGDAILPVIYFGQTYVEGVTGLKALSGELSGPMVYNGTGTSPFALSGTTATLVITFATGCSVSVSAVFGSTRTGVSPDGLGTFSIGFTKAFGSSDPTIAWDTTS